MLLCLACEQIVFGVRQPIQIIILDGYYKMRESSHAKLSFGSLTS